MVRTQNKDGLLLVDTGQIEYVTLLPELEIGISVPWHLIIGIEESKTAFDNGEAIFVDVRSESFYAAGHIPGAVSIPLTELEGRIDELNPEKWIITYCT